VANRVLAVPRAELLQLEPVGVVAPALVGDVVPALALLAGQGGRVGRMLVAATGALPALSAPDRVRGGVTQGVGKSLTRTGTCVDAAVETMQSVPDAFVSLAEGPPRTAGCIYLGSSALLQTLKG